MDQTSSFLLGGKVPVTGQASDSVEPLAPRKGHRNLFIRAAPTRKVISRASNLDPSQLRYPYTQMTTHQPRRFTATPRFQRNYHASLSDARRNPLSRHNPCWMLWGGWTMGVERLTTTEGHVLSKCSQRSAQRGPAIRPRAVHPRDSLCVRAAFLNDEQE